MRRSSSSSSDDETVNGMRRADPFSAHPRRMAYSAHQRRYRPRNGIPKNMKAVNFTQAMNLNKIQNAKDPLYELGNIRRDEMIKDHVNHQIWEFIQKHGVKPSENIIREMNIIARNEIMKNIDKLYN